eukprot:scaffold4240_cov73-Phaeocystis_antarctica.AAC.5
MEGPGRVTVILPYQTRRDLDVTRHRATADETAAEVTFPQVCTHQTINRCIVHAPLDSPSPGP